MNKLKLYIKGIAGIVSVSLITLFASGCGNGDPTTDEELVGLWDMTQMVVMLDTVSYTFTPGVDTVSGTLTLNDDSTYNYYLDINDTITIGTFPVALDTTISSSGDWSATDDSLTLNDPLAGEQKFAYEIDGNTMITTGTMAISIVNVTIIQTWKKQ